MENRNEMMKFIVISTLLVLWIFITFTIFKAVYRISHLKSLDSRRVILAIRDKFLPDISAPITDISDQVKDVSKPIIELNRLKDFRIGANPPPRIDAEFLRDRTQYLLVISNSTDDPFTNLEFRLQLPYPIEAFEFSQIQGALQPILKPEVGGMAVASIGDAKGGSVQMSRKPISRTATITVVELKPKGVVEVLLLLNSWRDPRGKEATIPESEIQRYFIPNVSPQTTYLLGTYELVVKGKALKYECYAPFSLGSDKVVKLEEAQRKPDSIMIGFGFE